MVLHCFRVIRTRFFYPQYRRPEQAVTSNVEQRGSVRMWTDVTRTSSNVIDGQPCSSRSPPFPVRWIKKKKNNMFVWIDITIQKINKRWGRSLVHDSNRMFWRIWYDQCIWSTKTRTINLKEYQCRFWKKKKQNKYFKRRKITDGQYNGRLTIPTRHHEENCV